MRLPRMGLGCMSLSHAYGTPPSLEDGVALVRSALDDGVQLLGGHGFVKEHPVERWYRDLRAVGIMEGAVLV